MKKPKAAQKAKPTPAEHKFTSDPAEMRARIIQQFETIPTATRDIIAHFYIMVLAEKLPEWKKQGEAARKLEKAAAPSPAPETNPQK